MAFIVEDGTGVADANAYATVAQVNAYLTDRNRQEENDWNGVAATEQEAAIVLATDYIEQRFALRFLGRREFQDVSAARATLTFTGQPLDAEAVTIDTRTYTFRAALVGADDVLIGASTSASILNLVNAISATSSEAGVTHGSGTVVHATVEGSEALGDAMLAEAKAKGTAGNGIVSTETLTAASWSSATLLGGGDVAVPQSLSFPRINLLDREGLFVNGIPAKLVWATAEYAVRAVDGTNLAPDPTIDASGRTITKKREELGPIVSDITFEEGAALSQITRSYPAADRLLDEYLASQGRVIRG